MNKQSCLVWLIFILVWIVVGVVTYIIIDPKTFVLCLVWILAWVIMTFLVDVTITAGLVLIEEFKKDPYED